MAKTHLNGNGIVSIVLHSSAWNSGMVNALSAKTSCKNCNTYCDHRGRVFGAFLTPKKKKYARDHFFPGDAFGHSARLELDWQKTYDWKWSRKCPQDFFWNPCKCQPNYFWLLTLSENVLKNIQFSLKNDSTHVLTPHANHVVKPCWQSPMCKNNEITGFISWAAWQPLCAGLTTPSTFVQNKNPKKCKVTEKNDATNIKTEKFDFWQFTKHRWHNSLKIVSWPSYKADRLLKKKSCPHCNKHFTWWHFQICLVWVSAQPPILYSLTLYLHKIWNRFGTYLTECGRTRNHCSETSETHFAITFLITSGMRTDHAHLVERKCFATKIVNCFPE